MSKFINETRMIYKDDLRSLCIKKNWYTKGANEEYEKMLNLIASLKDVCTSHIVEAAEDIKKHSDTEQEITSICFDIARVCNSYFEIVEV